MNSNTNNNAGGNKDYLDKGLDAAEKKFGGSMGSNPDKNRGMNEKIVRPPATLCPPSESTWLTTDSDRWRTRHVREGHRQEGPREVLQLRRRTVILQRRGSSSSEMNRINLDCGLGWESAGMRRFGRRLRG
jgi:hypothetical protein